MLFHKMYGLTNRPFELKGEIRVTKLQTKPLMARMKIT